MIDKKNSKLRALEITLIIFIFLFLLNFIFINFMFKRNEFFYISDVFLYVVFTYIFIGLLTLYVWRKNNRFHMNLTVYRSYLNILLILLIMYFLSSYVLVLELVDQTVAIIADKIIRGNPALYLNFSYVNLTTLNFVNGLLVGINSPFIIFFMVLMTQFLSLKSHRLPIITEQSFMKDTFLYKYPIFYLWFVTCISSFLSINLITIRYSFIGLIEMIFSILIFILAVIGMILSFKWTQTKGFETPYSKSTYQHLFAFKILKLQLMFLILLSLHHLITYYYFENFGFRFTNVLISLCFSFILFVFHYNLKKLD